MTGTVSICDEVRNSVSVMKSGMERPTRFLQKDTFVETGSNMIKSSISDVGFGKCDFPDTSIAHQSNGNNKCIFLATDNAIFLFCKKANKTLNF